MSILQTLKLTVVLGCMVGTGANTHKRTVCARHDPLTNGNPTHAPSTRVRLSGPQELFARCLLVVVH